MQSKAHTKKILEVQFLRAIAVLFVVFFHLFPNNFIGGYIGVDIFLFLSGFLMMKVLDEKKQSIKIFYLTRIKRIFPTLAFIVIISCFLSIFIFLKDIQYNFIYQAISSIFFYSNFFFWISTQNYFGIESFYQPLLHTWSLSLEFQFYLLIPFIYLVIKKYHKNHIIFLIFLIFVSTFLSHDFIGRSQSFYLLPYRLNEFLIGSLFFFLKRRSLSKNICDIIFFFILLLIIYLGFTYNQNNFPGLKAFFVSLLVFIFLYFNNYRYAFAIINNRFMQHLGKISYSLFLLHWPLIVFFNYFIIRELSVYDKFILFILIIFLSNLLYYFVEDKFAQLDLSHAIRKIRLIFLSLIFILCCSFILIKSDIIYELRLNPEKINLLKDIKNDDPYLLGFKKNHGFEFVDHKKRTILIFGDSHAHDIHFSLRLINDDYNYLFVSNNLDCSKILSKNLNIHWFDKLTNLFFNKKIVSQYLFDDCSSQYNKLDKVFLDYKIDKILISMKWNNSEIDNVDYIISYFADKISLNNVILFSRRLEIPDPNRAILFLDNNFSVLNTFFNNNKIQYLDINQHLMKKISNLTLQVINIDKYILQSDGNFTFFDEKLKKPHYVDSSHFSITGGKSYVQRFYNDHLK
jgi:peptidoglycan/LPS O-acetylase OafA/YrhL